MDEKEVQQILIEILYAELNVQEKSPDIAQKLTQDMLLAVYRLAKKHDLAHLVAEFAYRNGIVPEGELKAALQKMALTAVYRYERMRYAFLQICQSFDEAEIAYIPLKGSVLRPYYPQESMRTSCDIDILVREEDLDAAIACLESKGFTRGERHYHDVSMYSPNNIHLELHFCILEDKDFLDAVLKDAWNYAVPAEGSRYAFKKEFFVFHMYAHMAYHFLTGGCGIRALMDLWVMEHKMDAGYSCAKNLLRKAGILKFAEEMSRISEQCFTENQHDGFSDMILKYIYRGGVYGSVENHIAVHKSQKHHSLHYLLQRLFPRYQTMRLTYPALGKFPFLLPVFWIVRWIGAIFGGKTRRFAKEIQIAGNVSESMAEDVRIIRTRLGL